MIKKTTPNLGTATCHHDITYYDSTLGNTCSYLNGVKSQAFGDPDQIQMVCFADTFLPMLYKKEYILGLTPVRGVLNCPLSLLDIALPP